MSRAELDAGGGRGSMTEGEGAVLVEIRGLCKSYGDTPVLQGIDLTVEPGETLVIVGGSGEGKSVLLRHIAGLEKPDAGTIDHNGMDLKQYLGLAPHEKPFRISMVFQGAALLNSMTVAENVSLRLREHGGVSEAEIGRSVRVCLDQVEMQGTEEMLPGDLSGGMRKRVSIARALAAEPQLILYDEPTADLDPILTEQIGGLIKGIQQRRGTTQVVVTHNLALARETGDRIAVLHHGGIVDLRPAARLAESDNPHTQEFLRAAMMNVVGSLAR